MVNKKPPQRQKMPAVTTKVSKAVPAVSLKANKQTAPDEYSIEDPVEYPLKTVHQVAMKKAVGRRGQKPAATKRAPKKVLSNNERLRQLVAQLGVSQPVALELFNVGFGVVPMSFSSWKAYFVQPGLQRHRRFGDRLLAHAEKTLAQPS